MQCDPIITWSVRTIQLIALIVGLFLIWKEGSHLLRDKATKRSKAVNVVTILLILCGSGTIIFYIGVIDIVCRGEGGFF